MAASKHYGRNRLVNAIRAQSHRAAEDKRSSFDGEVVSVQPLQIELHESGVLLDDDEFTLAQDVVAYDHLTGLEVGDGVEVMRKHSGGDIFWLVTEVYTDADPQQGATQAQIDELQAQIDALGGPGGASQPVIKTQNSVAAIWLFDHDFPYKPNVDWMRDSAGTYFKAGVDYPSDTQVRITLSHPNSGEVQLS